MTFTYEYTFNWQGEIIKITVDAHTMYQAKQRAIHVLSKILKSRTSVSRLRAYFSGEKNNYSVREV